jgi:hypothetical protein
MLRQAREEIRNFEKADGKKDDPNHPAAKWPQALCVLRERFPRTPETAKATSEAVHLLIHADRFKEAYAQADQVASDEWAWEGLPQVLVEGASLPDGFHIFFPEAPIGSSQRARPQGASGNSIWLGRGWPPKRTTRKKPRFKLQSSWRATRRQVSKPKRSFTS